MSKRFDLSGKVALVTGASSGLGVHFARTLASAGASVAIAARRADRLASLQAELQKAGSKAAAVDLDVQSAKSVSAAFDAIEQALGAIDIVVNNAGISIVKPALDMPEEDWDAVVDTNLRGAWLVTQTAAKRWVAAKRPGVVVSIASILGLRTIGQVAPYNASKAGLIHLTRARHGMGALRHPGQRDLPGLHRDRDEQRFLEDARRPAPDRAHPAAPHRPARASRRRAAAAGLRRRQLHDRQRAHRRRWAYGEFVVGFPSVILNEAKDLMPVAMSGRRCLGKRR
jgi:NAD(P)-dependent dehydrogenase (short-subunit alcohol dehydrogenase family)